MLLRLCALFAEFEEYWRSDENHYVHSDGYFTTCGVMARLSKLIEDRAASFPESTLSNWGKLVSECMADPDFANTIGTCLLENLQDKPYSPTLLRYLSGHAQDCLAGTGLYAE